MAITFQLQEITLKLRDKTRLKSWISQIIQSEKKRPGEINFLFTTDREVLEKNIRFLNHDTLTDIITFDYCEGNVINGDIIISAERVLENAKKFDVDFNEELKRVMIHGVLHLCGYKDKSVKDKKQMREKEDAALARFAAVK